MMATKAKAEAKVEAVKAKADAATKLTIAKAKAAAKLADEKTAKNNLEATQTKLRLKVASANEMANKKTKTAKENAGKKAKFVKLDAKLKQRSVKEKATKLAMKNKTPGAEKVKRMARRASSRARELSRKAARQTRRFNRAARRKLRAMQEDSQDAVKAQARQAIKVLRRQARRAGISQSNAMALTPAQLLKLGKPPSMSHKQRDALKAAYAVGAARRAAKLAWIKVLQKVDEPTMKRHRMVAPNAPSVAAETAMKALVSTLQPNGKHGSALVQSAYKLQEGKSVLNDSDDALKLPHDGHWWDGEEHDGARNSEMPPNEAPNKNDSQNDEDPGLDDVPVNFGEELPEMTNKEAVKDAAKILRGEKTKLTKVKQQSAETYRKTKNLEGQLEERIRNTAENKLRREQSSEEENVKVEEENLAVARKRKLTEDKQMKSEVRRQMEEELQLVRKQLADQKIQEEAQNTFTEEEVKNVKGDLKGVLKQGETSHSNEFDAELYNPPTKVISVTKYNKLKAQIKAEKLKKSTIKKAAASTMLAVETKQANDKKIKRTQQKQLKIAKAAKVKAAMSQLETAQKLLSTAVNSKPDDEGMEQFLNTPAKPDDVDPEATVEEIAEP